MILAPLVASAALSCSAATARHEILTKNVQITGLEKGGTIPVAPQQVDRVICADFTRDGRTDMAVTIYSGGTAGDIAWLVFVRSGKKWKLSLNRSGYKVGLYRVGGDLVDAQPIYRKHDPNCCPTGGFDHTRWHWNGKRFVALRSWHNKDYGPQAP